MLGENYQDLVLEQQFNNALSLYGIMGVERDVPSDAPSVQDIDRVMKIYEDVWKVFEKHGCTMREAWMIASALAEAIPLSMWSGDVIVQDKE